MGHQGTATAFHALLVNADVSVMMFEHAYTATEGGVPAKAAHTKLHAHTQEYLYDTQHTGVPASPSHA